MPASMPTSADQLTSGTFWCSRIFLGNSLPDDEFIFGIVTNLPEEKGCKLVTQLLTGDKDMPFTVLADTAFVSSSYPATAEVIAELKPRLAAALIQDAESHEAMAKERRQVVSLIDQSR